MGDLSNILSNGQSGAYNTYAQGLNKAENQEQGMYNQGEGMLQPWMSLGNQAAGQYQGYLGNLQNMQNGNWMKNYQESPYAKYLSNKGLTSMNNAAAATGVLGSGGNQQENADLSNQIAGQDMNNYFNNEMQLSNAYGTGLNNEMGYGFNASNQGANLGQQYAHDLSGLTANEAQAQANSQHAGTQGKVSAVTNLLSGALGAL